MEFKNFKNLLAQKQEDALQNMSEDELKKMLDELG